MTELKEWIKERRWFRGKTRTIVDAQPAEVFPLDLGTEHAAACLLLVKYEGGEDEKYVAFSREGAFSTDALADGQADSAPATPV